MRVLRATFSRSPSPSLLIFFPARWPVLLTLDNQSSVASSPDPFSRRLALCGGKTRSLAFSLSASRRADELAASPFVRPREVERKITGAVQSSFGLISLNTLTVLVIVFGCCRHFLSLRSPSFVRESFVGPV